LDQQKLEKLLSEIPDKQRMIFRRLEEISESSTSIHNKDESFACHLEKSEEQLFNKNSLKLKIYLDTNFWISLRDVQLSRPKSNDDSLLLDKLLKLNAAGKIICPISDTIFFELLKQKDKSTKIAMAKIIDILCHGTIIKSYFDRLSIEFYHFLRFAETGTTPPELPAEKHIWSKIPYLLGAFIFTAKQNNDIQDIINKYTYDFISEIRLSEFMEMLDNNVFQDVNDDFDAWIGITRSMNVQKRANDTRNPGINSLHADEIAGLIGVMENQLGQIMLQVLKAAYGDRVPICVDEKDRQLVVEGAKKVIYNIFKFKKNKMAMWLPTYHVTAILNAAMRKDLKRNFKPNDFFDFKHASAAMPYCDIFATDKPLAVLLRSGELQLDKKYNTKVVTNTQELLSLL